MFQVLYMDERGACVDNYNAIERALDQMQAVARRGLNVRVVGPNDEQLSSMLGMPPGIQFVYDDGGRSAAGFKGEAGDCVVRAFAIATERDYSEVYKLVNDFAKRYEPQRKRGRSSARNGVRKPTTKRIASELGLVWKPTMAIGSGCRVHLREDELPKGRIVVNLTKHLAAVIDGVLHDIYDSSRNGTRCVYGYWSIKQ